MMGTPVSAWFDSNDITPFIQNRFSSQQVSTSNHHSKADPGVYDMAVPACRKLLRSNSPACQRIPDLYLKFAVML
jgi:hypothetical protein